MDVTTTVVRVGFSFRVTFLDEDGFYLDKTTIDIKVEETDDPEDDRDRAYEQVDKLAEKLLEDYSADSFEIKLVDAW